MGGENDLHRCPVTSLRPLRLVAQQVHDPGLQLGVEMRLGLLDQQQRSQFVLAQQEKLRSHEQSIVVPESAARPLVGCCEEVQLQPLQRTDERRVRGNADLGAQDVVTDREPLQVGRVNVLAHLRDSLVVADITLSTPQNSPQGRRGVITGRVKVVDILVLHRRVIGEDLGQP